MDRRTLTLSLGTVLATLLFFLTSRAAMAAAPASYALTPVAFLGDAAPGGGHFMNDFEPTRMNSSGDLAFTADLSDMGQEGVFLASGGKILPIMRYGQPAPGGGTFAESEFGNLGLNDAGDMALAFSLEPFPTSPLYLSSGLYRWSHTTQTLTPVVVSLVTPAPGAPTFAGVGGDVWLNNRGDIAFTGLTATDKGVHISGETYVGYGMGAYVADAQGKIASVASPGDASPGGSTFDLARGPVINEGGDVAFAGHRVSDPCGPQRVPEATAIGCNTNVYVKRAASGQIEAIAQVGDALPGGGTLVGGGVRGLNNAGDILFRNVLNPAMSGSPSVLYLHSGSQTVRLAGPGDAMPGGGKIAVLVSTPRLNNKGDVIFSASLDTKDEGVYLYSQGSLSLIAKSGTDIPGVGTIYDLEQGNSELVGVPPLPRGVPSPNMALSDQGQVAFVATLKDARIGLLLATPKP